jgi:hypothetical protein
VRIVTAPRATALAALFVTGTIAGAAAVALASSASSAPPSLVAGSLLSSDSENSAEGFVTLTIDVFNSSEADLPVMVRSFAGWPVSETDLEVLPARAWTQLEITTAPDCAGMLTEVTAVDAGSYSLDVPLDPGIPGILRRVRDEFCGMDPRVFAETKVESATAEDQGLRMDLRLLGHGRRPLGDLQIIEAHSGIPGGTLHVTNLPEILGVDGSIVLDAYWTIDDCTVALQAIVRPAVTFITAENVAVEAPLDDRGVAAFARYVANECTP